MLTVLLVLSKWELLILLIISGGLLFLGLDLIKRVSRKKQNRKMLREYIRLKSENWDKLIGVLTDNRNLDIVEIQTYVELDFSIFNRKYRDIIYHEVLKIKNETDVNPWNFKVLTRMLIN